MSTIDHTPWRRRDREMRLTAIFADAGIASSEALLSVLAALYRDRPDDLAHAQRVAHIAVRIANELGVSERSITHIERAAWTHDLGKLVIPERPDGDTDAVTPADIERWSQQLAAACDILDAAPALRPAAALVIASRECMDGSGFPKHLEGEAIPLGSRILHVADTFDALQELCAMFSMPADTASVELVRHSGSRFDAAVVAAWLRLVEEQSMQAHPRSGEPAGPSVQ